MDVVESAEEAGGAAASEARLHAAAPDDVNPSSSSKSAAVESDASPDVGSDCATVDNDDSTPAQPVDQDTSPRSAAETVESSTSGDVVVPSAAAATTSDDSSVQEVSSSFDVSTQWSSSTAGVDTDQSVDGHVHVTHLASATENDRPAATATTTTTTVTQDDVQLCLAGEVIAQPPCNSEQQEPQQHQEEQQPQQLPVEEDVPVQDFKAGITCTDVPTAIDVLSTRYRLADVTIHRNMITWSSWNIGDIVRGPHRESFWWRGRRTQRTQVQQQNDSTDNSSITGKYADEDERLAQHDVEEVCGKIERREREIALMLDQMDREAAENVITPLTLQQQQQQQQTCPAGVSAQQATAASPSQSDKRANVFQRLLRALRKRFARQQQQQQQQQQTSMTPDQQRQHQQALQRRQRTL